MDKRLIELIAGTLGSFLILSGAFLMVHRGNGIYWQFASLLCPILLLVATLIWSRIVRFHTEFAALFASQLPAELVYELRNQGVSSISTSELLFKLGSHIREQDALLHNRFRKGVLEHVQNRPGARSSLSESETTWRLLRAELSALEDQLKTDQYRDGFY